MKPRFNYFQINDEDLKPVLMYNEVFMTLLLLVFTIMDRIEGLS